MLDQVAWYETDYGHPWPNCTTPDCENKRCCWSDTDRCFPCAEKLIGHNELIRRYNATHDLTWDEAKRLEAEEDAEMEAFDEKDNRYKWPEDRR